MTNPGRLKDLSDVLELIKILTLPAEFANSLEPFVQSKFEELWHQARKRYVRAWRDSPLTVDDRNAEDRDRAAELERMRSDGVAFEDDGGKGRWVTTDPLVAQKYSMVEESEYWNVDDGVPSNEIPSSKTNR
jgi:hypothetical protein